jgi:hypothetical protein
MDLSPFCEMGYLDECHPEQLFNCSLTMFKNNHW